MMTAEAGAIGGAFVCGPACGVVGGVVAFGLGAWGTHEFWSWYNSENASDKERRKQEYQDYKDYQRQGYNRDEDPCKNLRNKIRYHKELNRRRSAWDKNWPHEKYPGGRHADDIANDTAKIARWEREYNKMCKCEE